LQMQSGFLQLESTLNDCSRSGREN
jgi:hypothetical protein